MCRVFWDRVGDGLEVAAAAAGVSVATGQRWVREAGGVAPRIAVEVGAGRSGRGRRLTLEEREEIAILNAQQVSAAEIARRVGVHRATIGRELVRGTVRARTGYRASVAQKVAEVNARRSGSPKLQTNAELAAYVDAGLAEKLSPEQIEGRLKIDFPDDEGMRVSDETIYRSLYLQGRGGLRKEVAKSLRTGRAVRKPRRRVGERRGKIPGMINISERPEEVADRSVPGHWEGDLILGSTRSASAIGTLVERTTGFVLLLHLPARHDADTVEEAIVTALTRLPEFLRRSLTWDQGSEAANHVAIAARAGLDVYFCDPHSPWQRGLNENTNGLLRQYFPKGTDLSVFPADYLDWVAAQLNARPRKRHGFKTPAEKLQELLSSPTDPSVALTA